MSVKLLLDTCVWGGVKPELVAAGLDVVWVGDRDPDPGDDAILAEALHEKRILVTLDKDFGELVIVKKAPHAGIIRLVTISARQQAKIILMILQKHAAELEAGAIITAEPGRLRVRPAEAGESA